VTRSIDRTTLTFNWPGLHVLSASGKPASATAFKLDWAGLRRHPLVAGAVTAAILGLAPAAALLAYGTTVRQLGWAIVTVA
jgi:lactate permease